MAARRGGTQNPALIPGEKARIIQPDSAGWGHELKVGAVVTLQYFDATDSSWKVRATDPRNPNYEWDTWVAQDDLGPDFDPVTDDEIAELFGLRN